MTKTLLITGSTDGIGLATARKLIAQGHRVLLHGRNPDKLEQVTQELNEHAKEGQIEGYVGDLSSLQGVEELVQAIKARHSQLDVLINNAGIFRTGSPICSNGHDVRFMVNTFAPYLLAKSLLPLLAASGRIVNLSSAAQAPVELDALLGQKHLDDEFKAYAQSKLALTMWSNAMAKELPEGPVVVAVNPGSLLASKMVQEGFGVAGGDLSIGADILIRAALADEFADASGLYFDNDAGQFAAPHSDALDDAKVSEVVAAIETVVTATP